ncbi:MAG: hypothetical protein VXZ72_01905, partial [Chlamydiota bacterium]|nr:hypothetical protein [Chlamydiota bacterium]
DKMFRAFYKFKKKYNNLEKTNLMIIKQIIYLLVSIRIVKKEDFYNFAEIDPKCGRFAKTYKDLCRKARWHLIYVVLKDIQTSNNMCPDECILEAIIGFLP